MVLRTGAGRGHAHVGHARVGAFPRAVSAAVRPSSAGYQAGRIGPPSVPVNRPGVRATLQCRALPRS